MSENKPQAQSLPKEITWELFISVIMMVISKGIEMNTLWILDRESKTNHHQMFPQKKLVTSDVMGLFSFLFIHMEENTLSSGNMVYLHKYYTESLLNPSVSAQFRIEWF